jgi:hypothetical protein
MEGNELVQLYLTLFHEAWKNAYKLGWIYHRMMEVRTKEEVLAFFATAEAQGYPLVPEACHAHAGVPFFLTVVDRGFSDWMYRVTPDAEKFIKNALANSRRLQASRAKWKDANKACQEDLRQRGWEALDSFGGETKGLNAKQLRYDSRNRKTGKGMSERTWAK